MNVIKDFNKKNMNEKELALYFLTLSQKYLFLVQNILNETIKSGNLWFVHDSFNCAGLSHEEIVKKISLGNDEKTKWNDSNVIIPTLFNFYHGIELLMKGFLFANKIKLEKTDHNLEALLEKVNSIPNLDKKLLTTFEKYILKDKITNQFLINFFDENELSPKSFFIILKYPTDKQFVKFYQYSSIYYKEKNLIPFLNEINLDIKEMNNLVLENVENKKVF